MSLFHSTGNTNVGLQDRIINIAEASMGTIGSTEVVLLQVQLQVQRNLTPIQTLSHGVLWATQPVQATLTIQTIFSKSNDLIKQITDPCTPQHIKFDLNTACNSQYGSGSLSLLDGVASQVGFTASAQTGYIAGDVTFMGTQVEVTPGQSKKTNG